MDPAPTGAYGLRVEGPDLPEHLGSATGLIHVSDDEPCVEVRIAHWTGSDDDRPENDIRDDRARVRLLAGGWIDVDRVAATATFHLPGPVSADDLVHPLLGPVGGIFARWLGREAFHGAGIVVDGAAWALLGDKEAGKSTFAAWLDRQDVPVLTDDMLVVDLGLPPVAHAGPRSIDLRPATVEALDLDGLERVRDGERFRLRLGPVPATTPLRGFVRLVEAADLTIERIAPADRLEALAPHRVVRHAPRDPAAMLDLTTLPMYELRRPKDWARLDEAASVLLETLDDA